MPRSCRSVLFTAAFCLLPALVFAQSPPAASQTITGKVLDPSGAPIAGAEIVATSRTGQRVAAATSGADGSFTLAVPADAYRFSIAAAGFIPRNEVLTGTARSQGTFVLTIAGVQEAVSVEGVTGYSVAQVPSAMRTATPLRDVPQSVSIVTRTLIADQGMQGLADVVRYMPGVGIAQGEGNRDTPVLRGQATTADFFVDGIRDDVQYMRDLYNVDRVEALKGPNAMIFGRGGAGGVINRVTRQADWAPRREITLQFGSWNQRRVSADAGWGLSPGFAARVTGLYEDSESYRDGVGVRRYGVNPTGAVRLGDRTVLRAGYEFFHDERTADRGVSSLDGAPLVTDPAIFFGDPLQSPVRATVNVGTLSFDHAFGRGGSLRTRLSAGTYDKFYQNVFPGAVNATAETVQITAYNNATDRTNFFNQTDLTLPARTGPFEHKLVFGAEAGRQVTDNFRSTGHFVGTGATSTSVAVPLDRPTIHLPLEFRQVATDADNHGVATTLAVYAQDQLRLARPLEVILGLRLERFGMDLTNNRTGQLLSSTDTLLSPRLGLVYKPVTSMSVYGSYSLSYLPRAGEQLSSLTATTQALDPETFRNYEVGAKWDVRPSLALTVSAYRLDRGNVAVADPSDPTRLILVDAQRTRGIEIGWMGDVTDAWSVAGGYALQDGEITRSLSANAQAGASLAQLPRHSLSIWNKYQFHPRVGAGVGVVHRGASYTSTDNRVLLPAFTRLDAGLFFDINARLRAQINVENVLDEGYFASAHSNTNITPGSPRAVRLALVVRP